MSAIPEAGRQAAHILLDVVAAWDEDRDGWEHRANLALDRLNEVGAVTGTIDDETEVVTLDASNLLGGAGVALQWLVSHLAAERRSDRLEVIAELRDFLDES